MIDPPRLLSEEDDPSAAEASHRDALAHHALKRALLRSAKADGPPPEARQRALEALGLGDEAVSAMDAPMHRERRAPSPLPLPEERAPMFASILQKGGGLSRRFGAPAVASTLAHAALVLLVLYGQAHDPALRAEQPEVTWRPPAPLFVPPGEHAKSAPAVEAVELPRDPAPHPVPEVIGRAAERDHDKPAPAAAPPPRPQAPAAVAEAPLPSPAGAGALAPPVDNATPAPSEEILPFGEGMSRPRRIDGPEPEYPRAAREARVTGTMLVKCVITKTGALERCQVLKSLPLLDEPVLAALAKQRYTPVTFQGRTINVEYVIPLKFELP